MAYPEEQELVKTVGGPFDFDTHTFSSKTSAAGETAHDAHTSDNAHGDELAITEDLERSLETLKRLSLNGEDSFERTFGHDVEHAVCATPWFPGKHAVNDDTFTTTTQGPWTKECRVTPPDEPQHNAALDAYAFSPPFSNGTNWWANTLDGTQMQHTGPFGLPTDGTSMFSEEVQDFLSLSDEPSQYTTSATLPSGFDAAGGFGDGPTDLGSTVSSFALCSQLVDEQAHLNQAPFSSIGPGIAGHQFSSYPQVQPAATKTVASPTGRPHRRRSSTKGHFELKCMEPGCGWTFKTRADLRHHGIKHNVNKGRSHPCARCSRHLRYPKDLRRHEQTHVLVRVNWFACQEPGCGSSFSRSDNLKRHQRTHAKAS